jgi:hypothetical protein
VASVLELYEKCGFPNVPELVELKHEREAGTISEKNAPRYLEDLGPLAEALDEACAHSVLPPERPNREALSWTTTKRRARDALVTDELGGCLAPLEAHSLNEKSVPVQLKRDSSGLQDERPQGVRNNSTTVEGRGGRAQPFVLPFRFLAARNGRPGARGRAAVSSLVIT